MFYKVSDQDKVGDVKPLRIMIYTACRTCVVVYIFYSCTKLHCENQIYRDRGQVFKLSQNPWILEAKVVSCVEVTTKPRSICFFPQEQKN